MYMLLIFHQKFRPYNKILLIEWQMKEASTSVKWLFLPCRLSSPPSLHRKWNGLKKVLCICLLNRKVQRIRWIYLTIPKRCRKPVHRIVLKACDMCLSPSIPQQSLLSHRRTVWQTSLLILQKRISFPPVAHSRNQNFRVYATKQFTYFS